MPESAAITKATRAQLAEWEQIYGTKERQLFRWIALGREVQDPCPLNDPTLMPAWMARHKPNRRVPPKITQAAECAQCAMSSATQEQPPEQKTPTATEQPIPGEGQPQPQPPPSPIDISQFQLDEGEAITLQRQIVGALHEELRKAYAMGWPTESLQARFNKAAANLRVLEKDDREAGVHRGKYTPTAEVDTTFTQMANMLRQMRESMERRVLELCPSLTPEQRTQVADAIRAVRSQEDRIFQRAPQFQTSDELFRELAPVA